jgi:hypothetical protein
MRRVEEAVSLSYLLRDGLRLSHRGPAIVAEA